jgi:hypothetical protein
VLASAGDGSDALRLGSLGFPRYRSGRRALRSDYLDAVGRDYVQQAREMHTGELADRIHGRAVDAGGSRWLQYWFFYLFNNKAFLGFGLHEGDWEMVQLRVDDDGRPSEMAFAQHEHGQRCRWELVEKRGERPVAYVARGSQASYASAGRHDAPVVPDYADGRGREVASATLDLIADDEPAWVAWPGRWGSSKARSVLESNSPRGPAHQDKWSDPATFHDECDEVDPHEATPESMAPAPPSPQITARRVAGRAVIDYRFPSSSGQPEPAQLIVTLDSPQDDLPPATYAHPVESPSGEVEHPLALEPEQAYEVLVSAADERGNVSEPVGVPLQ